MTLRFLIAVIAVAATSTGVSAQLIYGNRASVNRPPAWQACAQLNDDPAARLACYDRWTLENPEAAPSAQTVTDSLHPAAPIEPECNDPQLSALSRFWELERASDCGRFNIRGYYPISISWALADSVNTAPSSPPPGHSATPTEYVPNEGRIQVSIRTKIGQGLWPDKDFGGRDSLWFAYTQQSYWQLFSPSISRPFRITDHEPEIIYIMPTDAELPLGWRWRYSGISLNHQSNGQPLPLSRSWNRVILMAGMEKDQRFTMTGRVWQRISEDAQNDDNPEISDLVGRGEIGVSWNVNKDNTLAMTVRHSLTSVANGSVRLEWLRTLSNNQHNQTNRLRFHVQLFSGYGDSLLDYNYYRTVLNIGLSLVDW